MLAQDRWSRGTEKLPWRSQKVFDLTPEEKIIKHFKFIPVCQGAILYEWQNR